jgi:PhnB protein
VTDTSNASATLIQPLLVVRDAAAAISFYQQVFGAVEQWRLMHYQRVGHAVLRLGQSEFVLLDEFPEAGIVGPPVEESEDGARRGPRLLVQVDDVDGVLARAEAAGATVLRVPADQWWGVRSGAFRDPFGHHWSVHTIVEPMSIAEMQRRSDALGLYPPPRVADTSADAGGAG